MSIQHSGAFCSKDRAYFHFKARFLNRISKINGIFITNNFSFASVIEGISYPVINNTELIEWFSKNP